MAKWSKASRIVDLKKTGDYSNAQIAEHVGCGEAYVSAAWARHLAGGMTDADMRWYEKRRHNPAFQENNRRRFRAYYHRKKAQRAQATA